MNIADVGDEGADGEATDEEDGAVFQQRKTFPMVVSDCEISQSL